MNKHFPTSFFLLRSFCYPWMSHLWSITLRCHFYLQRSCGRPVKQVVCVCNKNAFQTLICKRWDVTKLQTPWKHVRCILLLTRKVFRHGGWGSVGEKPAAQNHRHFCLCWYYRTGFTANLGPVLSSRRRVGVEASHFYRLKEKDKTVLFATSAGTCTLDSAKSSHHLKSLLWQAKTINCTPKLFKGAILFYSWAVSGVLSSPVMFLGASSRTSQIYVTLSHELQHKAGDFFSLQVSITLVSQSVVLEQLKNSQLECQGKVWMFGRWVKVISGHVRSWIRSWWALSQSIQFGAKTQSECSFL